jgi:protein-tyrosine phosphatase
MHLNYLCSSVFIRGSFRISAMNQEAPISKPKRPRVPISPRVWIAFAGFMLVMVGGTFGVFYYNVIQTYHFAPVEIGVLYRCGNRSVRELKHAIALTQTQTVVSLIDDNELHDPAKPQFLEEVDYCNTKQQFIRIPVKLGGWPTSEDIQSFLKIVGDAKNRPVLVHCAQGVRRTGMFVAAYQESVQHLTPQQAKDAIMPFGHKESDTDDIRRFIDAYDPDKQTVTPISGSGPE